MAIRDLMSANVEVIAPETPVAEAARRMADEDIGFLPICDGERIIGALTDRDITARATAVGLDPATTCVRDIMTTDIAWCRDDDDIERVSQLMKERQIHRVIVVDGNKRLVGVVTLGDLARAEHSESGEVLQAVAQAPPTR